MGEIEELQQRRQALVRGVKERILRRIRQGGGEWSDDERQELARLASECEAIDAELEAAYYRRPESD